MNDDRRRYRRETQLLSSESAWLQKAVFALQKAEDAREKLAESRGEDAGGLELSVNDSQVSIDEVQDGLEGRARTIQDEVKERRRSMR